MPRGWLTLSHHQAASALYVKLQYSVLPGVGLPRNMTEKAIWAETERQATSNDIEAHTREGTSGQPIPEHPQFRTFLSARNLSQTLFFLMHARLLGDVGKNYVCRALSGCEAGNIHTKIQYRLRTSKPCTLVLQVVQLVATARNPRFMHRY